jgi:hypothetical protein
MQGRYFLDELDGITYSTDSYAIYNFYVLQGMEKKSETERTPLERSFECKAPANRESFLEAKMLINHRHHDILQHIAHACMCVCTRYNVVKYRRNRRSTLVLYQKITKKYRRNKEALNG